MMDETSVRRRCHTQGVAAFLQVLNTGSMALHQRFHQQFQVLTTSICTKLFFSDQTVDWARTT